MTAHQQQIRRDTATNLNAATPAAGELGYDTTNKRIIVGDGATAGGIKHASAKDVQNNAFAYGTVGGTANAITLTNSPVAGGYAAGQEFKFKATNSNSGATTVNVDTLGVKNIYKLSNGSLVALSGGEIISGAIYTIEYDGTQFQLKGAEPQITASGLVLLASYTASSDSSIDITGVLSSTYDDYVIVLGNVVTGNGGTSLTLRTSTDNGANFDSGGSDYYYATHINQAGVGESTSNAQGASGIVLIPSVGVGVSGEIQIFNVNSTTDKKMITAHTAFVGVGSSNVASARCSGLRDSTANIDALQLLYTGGGASVASGTIKVYGLSKT